MSCVTKYKAAQTFAYRTDVFPLVQCAAPKRWQASDGIMTQVDTPHTIRARALRDLYGSITLSSLSKEERLDVLLTLRHTLKVNNNQYFSFYLSSNYDYL